MLQRAAIAVELDAYQQAKVQAAERGERQASRGHSPPMSDADQHGAPDVLPKPFTAAALCDAPATAIDEVAP